MPVDARKVLESVKVWKLPSDEWTEAQRLLGELESTLDGSDLGAQQRTLRQLSLLDPSTRLGRSIADDPADSDEPGDRDDPANDPPDVETLELVNRLVHRIGMDAG